MVWTPPPLNVVYVTLIISINVFFYVIRPLVLMVFNGQWSMVERWNAFIASPRSTVDVYSYVCDTVGGCDI